MSALLRGPIAASHRFPDAEFISENDMERQELILRDAERMTCAIVILITRSYQVDHLYRDRTEDSKPLELRRPSDRVLPFDEDRSNRESASLRICRTQYLPTNAISPVL